MIHGLVVVNKPKDITSHTLVEKIKKLFRVKKAGHFGTLDPLAEGLLLIGLGNATKFFNFYIKKQKVYSGRIRFGYATTTYDAEGEPLSEKKTIDLYKLDIASLLERFTGKQSQTPPIYSAKKFKGKPLYKYARENRAEEIELKPVLIEIFSLSGTVVASDTLQFHTQTSSGTYIRSLAHDLGQAVGVGAYLEELKREGIGEFHLQDAFTPEQLADFVDAGEIIKAVTPIEALLPEFPRIIVNQNCRSGILNGMSLSAEDVITIFDADNKENVRLFDADGQLLAIAKKEENLMRFKPYIVFSG